MAKAIDLFMHQLRITLDPLRHTTDSDGQLLTRWLNNHDDRAFTALVCRHGALVWRVSRGILRQAEDAEEIFQATFLVLARKAAGLKRRSSISGWLYKTAHHLALNARTAKVRRARHEGQAGPKRAADLLEEISVREARAILGEELDRLSDVYREAILLCLYEGATQDEAAKRLGCSLRTLKRRLELGRSLLNSRLSKRGLAPESAFALTLYSHVPAQLISQTISTATKFAAGEAITGGAALLATMALRTSLLKKLGICCTLFLGLGSMTVARGFALAPGNHALMKNVPQFSEPPAQARPRESFAGSSGSEQMPRVDANGDPLPDGAISRIGSSRLRHFADVTRMLYTPDGKAIVSTSGHYLYLWDAATGRQRWRLGMAGGEHYLSTPVVAASSDSTKVAVLNEREYLLFDVTTSKQLARHQLLPPNLRGFFRCMAIAPDMGMFALGHDDATVQLFDAVTGQEKRRIVAGEKAQNQFPVAVEFSADSKTIYVLTSRKEDQKQIVVISFDTRTGKEIENFQPLKTAAADRYDRAYPKHLIRSHDNQLLAVMEQGIILRTNAKIVLWDLKAGKQRHFIERDLDKVHGGAFSPDGSLFAVASTMPYVVLFDTATGVERSRLPAPTGARSLMFSPDGKTLAFVDGACIELCDVVAGKHQPPSTETNALGRIRFANGGKDLLSVRAGVDWWEVASARAIKHLPPDPERFYISSVSPDGKLLAASLINCDMVLIDAGTGKQVRSLDGHKILNPVTKFSPDGTKLYSAGRHLVADKRGVARLDPRIIILNVATGKALNVLQSEADHVDQLAVSPDGRWLASGAWQSDIKDYDIRLWDLATGKVAHRLTPRHVASQTMLFSADSSRLVSVGGEPGRYFSGAVQLWDVALGKEVGTFTSQDEPIGCIAMTSDGRMLATGGDKTLRLWDVATGTERGRIIGHLAHVSSLDFSPNGNLLAAASSDAPIYLWNPYALKSKTDGTKLTKEGKTKLWQNLADTNAAVGFQAACELIARPKEAVALFEAEWKGMSWTTAKQMQKWIGDLSSDQFTVRKTAAEGLERFAADHGDLVREALQQASTLEVRQRLEKILGQVDFQRVRRSRMLEVLEQLGTAEASRFLQVLAQQKDDALTAREAAASLKRLEQQKKSSNQPR